MANGLDTNQALSFLLEHTQVEYGKSFKHFIIFNPYLPFFTFSYTHLHVYIVYVSQFCADIL